MRGAHAFPELAQVVHGPDGLAKQLHTPLADAGWAASAYMLTLGVPVSSSVRATMLSRASSSRWRFLVARGLPFFGPVLHSEHEAQCPDLGKRGDVLAGRVRRASASGRAATAPRMSITSGSKVRSSSRVLTSGRPVPARPRSSAAAHMRREKLRLLCGVGKRLQQRQARLRPGRWRRHRPAAWQEIGGPMARRLHTSAVVRISSRRRTPTAGSLHWRVRRSSRRVFQGVDAVAAQGRGGGGVGQGVGDVGRSWRAPWVGQKRVDREGCGAEKMAAGCFAQGPGPQGSVLVAPPAGRKV